MNCFSSGITLQTLSSAYDVNGFSVAYRYNVYRPTSVSVMHTGRTHGCSPILQSSQLDTAVAHLQWSTDRGLPERRRIVNMIVVANFTRLTLLLVAFLLQAAPIHRWIVYDKVNVNKKLRYRKEHSASVMLSWCQSSRHRICLMQSIATNNHLHQPLLRNGPRKLPRIRRNNAK